MLGLRKGPARVLPPPVGPKRPSRHPFEVGVILGMLGSAFSQLMAGPSPLSVNATMTPEIQTLLSTCMLVGAIVCLIGITWKEPLSARVLEIAGLTGLAGALGVYSWAYITTVSNWPSSQGIGITIGLFGACIARIIQAVAWTISVYRKAP